MMAERKSERLFSSADVEAVTGVTQRQLQWWDEQSLISPRQTNHRRLYSEAEVKLAAVLFALRQKGLSLHRIRQYLPILRKVEADYLVITGYAARWVAGDDEVIDLFVKTKGACLLVWVPGAVKGLRGRPR